MAYEALKEYIDEVIKENNNGEITGNLTNGVLKSIVNALGQYPEFAGIAYPDTVPPITDGPVFYIANQNGVYPNFGGYSLTNNDLVVFSNVEGIYEVMGVLPSIPVDGVVEEGNIHAVSGGEVYEKITPIINEIKGGDSLVGNSGNIIDYSIDITHEYCEVNLTPSITSGKINEIKLVVSKTGLIKVAVFQDETPDGSTLKALRNMGEVEVNCEILGVNIFTDFGGLQIEEGWYLGVRKMTGGALPYATNKAGGCARLASTTSPIVGNASNMGVHNYEFAIEGVVTISGIKPDIDLIKLELEDTLKLEDLDIKYGVNLLNPENRRLDQFIDSAGNILTGAGWELAFIDASSYPVGQEITFDGINIITGHAAWYNGSTKLAYAGSYTTASQPVTYLKPENATLLYITTMRSNVANPEIMVNLGEEALPYVPYEAPYVEKIAGYEVKGGSGAAYNQDLNTTDNVKFQSLEIQSLKAFLPTSDTGLENGDVWIDTANSNVLKVK